MKKKLIIEENGKTKEIEQTSVQYGLFHDESSIAEFEQRLQTEVSNYINAIKEGQRN